MGRRILPIKKTVSASFLRSDSSPSAEAVEAARKALEAETYESYLGVIPDKMEKPSAVSIFGDSIWLKTRNNIGEFVAKLRSHKIPGCPDGPNIGSFKMKLPKIPAIVLEWQTSFYRAVMDKFKNAEAYSSIIYDTEENTYYIYIPKQQVSAGSAKYDLKELSSRFPAPRYIEVMSCHSHNTMGRN